MYSRVAIHFPRCCSLLSAPLPVLLLFRKSSCITLGETPPKSPVLLLTLLRILTSTQLSISYKGMAFLSLFLLLSLPAALSQLTIPLNFYTDNLCANPSAENSSYSANINVCIITTGLGSVSFPSTPCASGSVHLLGFSDTTCVEEINISKDPNGCIAPFSGDVAAIIATCNQENEDGQINVSPTATATVDVGPVAGTAVATSPAALPIANGIVAITVHYCGTQHANNFH